MPENKYSMLMVRSVTHAIKGQKILESRGISSYVQRNTIAASQEGCGYALKIAGDPTPAVQLLQVAGIKVVKIQGA